MAIACLGVNNGQNEANRNRDIKGIAPLPKQVPADGGGYRGRRGQGTGLVIRRNFNASAARYCENAGNRQQGGEQQWQRLQ